MLIHALSCQLNVLSLSQVPRTNSFPVHSVTNVYKNEKGRRIPKRTLLQDSEGFLTGNSELNQQWVAAHKVREMEEHSKQKEGKRLEDEAHYSANCCTKRNIREI